jgi:hypothetical protein
MTLLVRGGQCENRSMSSQSTSPQPMSPERWKQVEALYHAVLEQDPSERAVLLEQADPELRREVE